LVIRFIATSSRYTDIARHADVPSLVTVST